MSFADSYPAKDNMHTGYAGNLTPQQQAAFAEFMAKIETSTFLSDLKKQAHPDWFALRFLRATMKDKSGQRVFQPVAAEKRFLATMQWRRDQNIDLVRTNLTNNTLPKHVSTYLAEVRPRLEWVCPRTGRPITLEKLGKFTQHVKTDCFTEEQWIECVTYDLERHLILFDALSEAKGWEIGTNIFIMDVAGGGMGIMSRLKMLRIINDLMSEHYPELAGPIMIFNAPWIYSAVFAAVSPFFDPHTKSKLVVSTKFDFEVLDRVMGNAITYIPLEYGGESNAECKACVHSLGATAGVPPT